MKYDVIIVGAGPAGMTAALYALRAEKSVLLLEREGYGGQIVLSDCVQNYPGIPDVNGYDLADAMMEQIRALGVTYVQQGVTEVTPAEKGYLVQTAKETYEGRALILATGVTHRKLEVPGEADFIGKGVSFCAVCDGAFFRKKTVAVVGGGNTAVQDALYLAQICETVYLIHRRDGFRAEETLLERAKQTPNIQFLTHTVVKEMRGELRLQSLLLENVQSHETRELEVAGVFEAIGSVPQNRAFAPLVSLDNDGYFAVDGTCRAGLPGVFVAGDCRQKQVRQLTTAVADGTLAALEAIEFLK